MAAFWLRIALYLTFTHAAYELQFDSDEDLTTFVSRPDIKVPLLDITTHDASAILPGQWFLAPYTSVAQELHPLYVYEACQIGPVIYDARGEVVWAGACDFRNENTHDFRPLRINGSDYLSLIVLNPSSEENSRGYGVLLNSSYDIVTEIRGRMGASAFNMHELLWLDNGDQFTAVHIATRPGLADLSDVNGTDLSEGWIADCGIREVDTRSGRTIFEWWPLDHVSPEDSVSVQGIKEPKSASQPWNWFHANSIDKNGDGDYLYSARYTSTIYKISGQTGSILWRLGGASSDFVLNGFNFSYQHDARWLSYSDEEEIISFLDNGADSMADSRNTTQTSSALVVALDKRTNPPQARVLRRWWRPDGKLTELRGNFQTFTHSNNVVIDWNDDGYITEHDDSGDVVLETRFRSDRMVTYRAYKGNFTASPQWPPDVAAFAYGTAPDRAVTVLYVSWNGATEVASWEFYSVVTTDTAGTAAGAQILLGSTPKTGFETIFQVDGLYSNVVAVAIDDQGVKLPHGASVPTSVQSRVIGSQNAAAGRRNVSTALAPESTLHATQDDDNLDAANVVLGVTDAKRVKDEL